MPFVGLLHEGFARVILLYFLALGVWGLVAWRTGRGVGPSYRGALLIAELVALLQGAAGAILLIQRPPLEAVHVLYGISIALALPVAYVYARPRPTRQQALVYAIASLFAVGLAIRGITTGA